MPEERYSDDAKVLINSLKAWDRVKEGRPTQKTLPETDIDEFCERTKDMGAMRVPST